MTHPGGKVPRTWMLLRYQDAWLVGAPDKEASAVQLGEGHFEADQVVEVTELEPVLDLLERQVLNPLSTYQGQCAIKDALAFLRANGRRGSKP